MKDEPEPATDGPAEARAGTETGAQGVARVAVPVQWDMPEPTSPRYPDYQMPFVGSQEHADQRFAEALESFLLGYGYNTARAYRADLEDIYFWARERGLDFFALGELDLKPYLALLRRRGYSEGTVRRRGTAWRSLSAVLERRSGDPRSAAGVV